MERMRVAARAVGRARWSIFVSQQAETSAFGNYDRTAEAFKIAH
jgi:hypothetical protein